MPTIGNDSRDQDENYGHYSHGDMYPISLQ